MKVQICFLINLITQKYSKELLHCERLYYAPVKEQNEIIKMHQRVTSSSFKPHSICIKYCKSMF